MPLPIELTSRPRWVLWRYEQKPDRDKPAKVPYSVRGFRCSSTNPNHWAEYGEAVRVFTENPEAYDGLGFVLGDGIAGIDYDEVIDSGGMQPWASEQLDRLRTYAEVSPSKTGAKAFVSVDDIGCAVAKTPHPTEKGSIEVYYAGRFFTVTGLAIGDGKTVSPMPADIIPPWAKLRAEKGTNDKPPAFAQCLERIMGMAPSVSGERGHDKIYAVAAEIARYGLTDRPAMELIRAFNASKCIPPWTDRDLQRKLREARKDCMRLGEIGKYGALTVDEFDDLTRAANAEPTHYGQSPDGVLTLYELLTCDFRVRYLIDQMLVKGQPLVVGGAHKSLKTSIVIDAAISLGVGGMFLGRFLAQKTRVLVATAESGWSAVQGTARRICVARGIQWLPETAVYFTKDIPNLGSPRALEVFRAKLDKWEPEVVVIDPAYLVIPGDDAGVLMKIGRSIAQLNAICERRGATLVLCHHAKRQQTKRIDPLTLSDLSWAGFAEFFRQWWLVNHRTFRHGFHSMWMNAGGSEGHGGIYGLEVYEGSKKDIGGRKWLVKLADCGNMEGRLDILEATENAD